MSRLLVLLASLALWTGCASPSKRPEAPVHPLARLQLSDDLSNLWDGRYLAVLASYIPREANAEQQLQACFAHLLHDLQEHQTRLARLTEAERSQRVGSVLTAYAAASSKELQAGPRTDDPGRRALFGALVEWSSDLFPTIVGQYAGMGLLEARAPLASSTATAGPRARLDLGNLLDDTLLDAWLRSNAHLEGLETHQVLAEWRAFLDVEAERVLAGFSSHPYAVRALILASLESELAFFEASRSSGLERLRVLGATESETAAVSQRQSEVVDRIEALRVEMAARLGEVTDAGHRSDRFLRVQNVFARTSPAHLEREADRRWRTANAAWLAELWEEPTRRLPTMELFFEPFDTPKSEGMEREDQELLVAVLAGDRQGFIDRAMSSASREARTLIGLLDEPDRTDLETWFHGTAEEAEDGA